MEYWPDPLVTTERVFSMSAGLDASTVTLGMTAPEESLTVPTIEAWACAMAGMTTTASRTRIAFTNLSIVAPKAFTAPGAMFSGTEPAPTPTFRHGVLSPVLRSFDEMLYVLMPLGLAFSTFSRHHVKGFRRKAAVQTVGEGKLWRGAGQPRF